MAGRSIVRESSLRTGEDVARSRPSRDSACGCATGPELVQISCYVHTGRERLTRLCASHRRNHLRGVIP